MKRFSVALALILVGLGLAAPAGAQWASAQSLFTEVYLGAIELDAQRLSRSGAIPEARARFRTRSGWRTKERQ